jgi:excinuclease ABC subunit A
VVEHNLDVIKLADWIIDMGPEAGDGGGQVVAMGRPEEIAAHPTSHTGRWLRSVLPPDAVPVEGPADAAPRPGTRRTGRRVR